MTMAYSFVHVVFIEVVISPTFPGWRILYRRDTFSVSFSAWL